MFLFLILCLVSFGLVMVYSAGSAFTDQMYDGDSLRYFKVQLVAAISGLSLMIVVSFLTPEIVVLVSITNVLENWQVPDS